MQKVRAYYDHQPYSATLNLKRNGDKYYYTVTLRHEGSGLIQISETFDDHHNAIAYLAAQYNLLIPQWKITGC